MTGTVDVEQLYKCFGVLADAKDKASEHVAEFGIILKGVKGNAATKRLASQFISRFFKHFPGKANDAINAVMDLCEDDDTSIRKAAIKEIPSLCKSDGQHLAKLADVLVQLMQTEDNTELSVVTTSLMSLFQINCKDTLSGLFSQINESDEVIRERAMKFMCTKIPKLNEDIMTKEVEDYIFTECKKIMEDVTGEEFQQLIKLLSNLQHLRTIQGRQQIVRIIADQMQQEEFNANDPDSVKRVLQCLTMAHPLISRNVHSAPFLQYVCVKVLPTLGDIPKTNDENEKLEIIKILAELSTDSGPAAGTDTAIEPLFNKLLDYMPLPPDEENQTVLSNTPKFDFSFVECLMFAFHQIASKHQDFLTKEESQERLSNFRKRLQYFARGVNVYIKQLKPALNADNKEENKVKIIALKTCNNINNLIKDLFHNPPAYKSTIHLSWKPPVTAAKPQKRHSIEATNDNSKAKTTRAEQQMYKTPSGKYSTSISPSYNRGRGSNYRGRGGRRGNNFKRY